MKNKNEEEEEFEYNDEDATEIILENISDSLKNKLDFDDIMALLEIKDEYFEKVRVNEEANGNAPVNIEWDAMNLFIITNAVQYDIILSMEEMEEIIEAELIYLKINEQVADPTELENIFCEKCNEEIPFGTPHYTIVKNLEFYCENPETKEAEIEVEESEQIIALCKSCGSYFNNENLEIILKHLPIPGQEIRN